MYLIKEVANMVGISVRMLHHYDKIGLLKPHKITENGYRQYNDEDLEKLQQILFFRELDFGLQEIKNILDSPSFDRSKALKSHKKLLVEKKKRLELIIKTVDKTINTVEGGKEVNKNEMFSAFDMSEIENHKDKYAQEVKEKYGNSQAYKESEKKISKNTKEDWARIMEEYEKIYKKIADNMFKGTTDPVIQEAVGEWRQHITDNYYNCTLEIFRGLGDMYVADERFTKNIDKYGEGLAVFLKQAMHAYCDNLQKQ